MVEKLKTNDPQSVGYARVRKSTKTDSEVITLSLFSGDGLVETVLIIPIPDEDRDSVRYYRKSKVHQSPPHAFFASLPRELPHDRPYDRLPHDQQTPQDKLDAQNDD